MKLKFERTQLGALTTNDTGADVSVMPVRIYKQLYPDNMSGEIVQGLTPCNMKLTTFNNTSINVIWLISLKTKHRDVEKTITFIITNVDTVTIIDRTDIMDPKYIQFLCDCSKQCKNDSSFVKSANISFNGRVAKKKWANMLLLGKTGNPKEDIINIFPELFNDIGCVNTLYII